MDWIQSDWWTTWSCLHLYNLLSSNFAFLFGVLSPSKPSISHLWHFPHNKIEGNNSIQQDQGESSIGHRYCRELKHLKRVVVYSWVDLKGNFLDSHQRHQNQDDDHPSFGILVLNIQFLPSSEKVNAGVDVGNCEDGKTYLVEHENQHYGDHNL